MRLPGAVGLLAFSMAVNPPVTPAGGHPGGLNAQGCHNNRKTGDYHCHRGSAARASLLGTLSGGAAYYRNCAAARAAGAAPIRRGEAGYADHLDRDGDGVACEPHRGR